MGLFLFLLCEMRKHFAHINERGVRLLLAGEALEKVVRAWGQPHLDDAAIEEIVVTFPFLLREANVFRPPQKQGGMWFFLNSLRTKSRENVG